jgi:hypothetical protein
MQQKKPARYWCPLVREMCQEGMITFEHRSVEWGVINVEHRSVQCPFGVSQVTSSAQCGLFRALKKLENLELIKNELHTLASAK